MKNQTKLSSIQEDVERNEIIIEWEDLDSGNAAMILPSLKLIKTTRLPSQWLRDHCYKDSERICESVVKIRTEKDGRQVSYTTCCHGELPSLEHTELMDASPDKNNAGLKQFLKYLDSMGSFL